MKKMKRMLSVLFALALMLGLTACSSAPTAQEVYDQAIANLNAATGLDANLDMTMTMSDETDSMDISMGAAMKAQDVKTETMKMDMLMNVDVMGMSVEMQTYYADGYYMMDLMGQKIKYAMPLDDAMEQVSLTQELSDEMMENLTMEESDGVRTLSYSVDVAKLGEASTAEEYMSILESMGLADMMGDTNMTYDSMSGTMTVNEDGYMTSNNVSMAGTVDVEGTPVNFELQMGLTYNNPGQAVTVEIPDASEYIEIDASMLE